MRNYNIMLISQTEEEHGDQLYVNTNYGSNND